MNFIFNPYMTRKQIASDLLSSHIWVGPSHDYRCASATIVMNGLLEDLYPQNNDGIITHCGL